MAEALANKYRPHEFNEVCSQKSIIQILKRQLEIKDIKNCYLFCGPSGTGKTTLARIFANKVNDGQGEPIEIDGASNNGVDNVKSIIQSAKERSVDSEYKLFIIDECVTGDTEVLTSEGWKRFDSLNKDELVAQYNNGKIEFVKPNEFIEKDYKGDMYNIHIGNKATFTMSPNHVQPLYYNKSKQIKESYVKDVKFTQSSRFIRSGEGVGELTHLSNLDRIAIMLQADGCLQNVTQNYNYWTIQVKKKSKKERLISLLKDSNLEYKQLHTDREDLIRFSVKTPCDITKKLFSHFSLNDMSSTFADEFIDELVLWDGYKTDKHLYYSCVDKDNVDFCQCVGILGGYKSRTSYEIDNRSEKYDVVYRLHLQSSEMGNSNSCVKKERIDFEGKIYCVKVPSHMILIRKDGYELVTGNCHMITTQGWNAFLKCIEEPPKYTIFIFCTTDPQKIPSTILNRVMRFNLTKVKTEEIRYRLGYICENENCTNFDEAIDYISKICNGGVRDAVAMLDKCISYSNDLSIENVMTSIGNFSYKDMLSLTNNIVDGEEDKVISTIDGLYDNGNDMKLFIEQYLDFVLDLVKYCVFKSMSSLKIPSSLEEQVKYTTGIENNKNYYNAMVDLLLQLKNEVRYDSNIKNTILVYFINMCRGIKC